MESERLAAAVQTDEETALLLALAADTRADIDAVISKDTNQPCPAGGHKNKDDNGNYYFHMQKNHVYLIVAAILYGTLNVALRGVYNLPKHPPSAAALSTAREWLAVLCFVGSYTVDTLVCKQTRPRSVPPSMSTSNNISDKDENDDDFEANYCVEQKEQVPSLYLIAFELAIWNFGAQGFQNISLFYINAARSAFLSQLSVVLTPLLALAFGHPTMMMTRHKSAATWWACLLAMGGLILFSMQEDGTSSSSTTNLNSIDNNVHNNYMKNMFSLSIGDLWSLASAVSWSMYLIRLSSLARYYSSLSLQGCKTFILTVLYTVWCLTARLSTGQLQWPSWWHKDNTIAWAILFYSAAGPGTLAILLQHSAQANGVSATAANVILSLEPVFTALCGRLWLAEKLTYSERWGGGLIVMAALLASGE